MVSPNSSPLLSVLLCAPLVVGLGCDRGGDGGSGGDSGYGPASKKPAPKASWSDDALGSKLEFEGASGKLTARVSGSYGDAILNLHLEAPKGTVLRVGDKTTKVESISASLDAPLEFKLGEVELKDATDMKRRVELGAEIEIELPNTEPLVTKVPPLGLRFAAGETFAEADKGSIEFAGEPEGEGQRDTLVFVSTIGSIEEIYGSGKQLQDIDLVALEEKVETDRTKLCKGYTKGDINFTIVDSTFRVYDRRTGEKIAQTTLEPSGKCPSMAMTTNGEASLWVDEAAKAKWLRTHLQTK